MRGLFFSNRDSKIITQFAHELVNKVMAIPCIVYKQDLAVTKGNIYGESIQKAYRAGVDFFAIIDRQAQGNNTDEFGYNAVQDVVFQFLRYDLERADFLLEPGDIVKYDNRFFEVTHVYENRYWGGINPDTMDADRGRSIGVIANTRWVREVSI